MTQLDEVVDEYILGSEGSLQWCVGRWGHFLWGHMVLRDQLDSRDNTEEFVHVRVRGVRRSWSQGVIEVVQSRGRGLQLVFGSGGLESDSMVCDVTDGPGHGA